MRGHKNFLCHGKGMTDYPYPIVGSSGSGILSVPNMAAVTAAVGVTPTTKGRGMAPHTVVPQLPDRVFEARGRSVHDLDEPNVPPGDVRFNRGPKLTGREGTIDIWFLAPTAGTARTLCYLTDDPASPTNVIAVRIDTSNRPLVTIVDQLGTTVGEVTPSYTAVTAGKLTHVRFTWDAVNPVDGTRHATLKVNEEAIPGGDWSTDPTSGWDHFKPTHMVLARAFSGDSDALPGTVAWLQASNVVQP